MGRWLTYERYVLGGVPELLELLREWGFRLEC